MSIIDWVLIVTALVCFLLATVGIGVPRINTTAFGLFCWLLSTVVS